MLPERRLRVAPVHKGTTDKSICSVQVSRNTLCAGCQSVVDDPTWHAGLILHSAFAALLLSNPWLERLDISRTGLTNAGLFYLLLEIAHCDPEQVGGHRQLVQLAIGPPAPCALDLERLVLVDRQPSQPPVAWCPSLADAVTELVAGALSLQVLCLSDVPPDDCASAVASTAGGTGIAEPAHAADAAYPSSLRQGGPLASIVAAWAGQPGRRARQLAYRDAPALVLDCGCVLLPCADCLASACWEVCSLRALRQGL